MSVPVSAPRFGCSECDTDRERRFVELLHARAEAEDWYADFWPDLGRVVLSATVTDRILGFYVGTRDYRVDFDGSTLIAGLDETGSFVTDLDPSRPDVLTMSGEPIEEMVLVAADWLKRGMDRPTLSQKLDTLRPFWRSWMLRPPARKS